MKRLPNYIFVLIGFILFISSCKKEIKEDVKQQEKEEFISKIDPSYAQIGLNITFKTKSEVSRKLTQALSNSNTSGALAYCNVNAVAITDSMATLHHAKIKRVSDKARNPNNLANSEELKHIESFKNILTNKEVLAPIIETDNDSVSFYYPIVTNNLCLQCHGNPNMDIDSTILMNLKELYPEDKAIGYKENEVRGIWSIRFQNNKE